MASIKVKTSKEHRFDRLVNIKGVQVQVDSEGIAEVPERLVIHALNADFELVDKNAKYTSAEDQGKTKETATILAAAEAKAQQILAAAEAKAQQILAAAETKAQSVVGESLIDEKTAKRKELLNTTNDELKAVLKDAGVEEKLWKDANKETLVNLIMEIAFGEDK
jgi:vacuolar-type H+-ATPase subunit H